MAAHRHAANRLSLTTSILHQPRTLTFTPIPATSILHQPRTPPPPRGSTRPAHCQSSALAPRPLRRLFVAAPLALPLALPPLALPPLALPPLALPPPPRLRQIVRPARDVRRRSVWRSAPPFWMATSRPTQKRTSRHQRRRHQRRRHQRRRHQRRRHQGRQRQRRRRQRRRREPPHSRHLQHRCRLHGRQHSPRQRRSRECRQRRRGQRRRLGSPPVLPRRPKRPRQPLWLCRPQLPTTTHSRASSARLFGR